MSTSRRTKRVRKRAKVFYDDDPSEGDTHCDVTISQHATGRVSRSTTLVSEREAGTSDSTDPWTTGFFDENSEAFVVDSLPDELQDFNTPALPLDPDEETRVQPKVLTVFTTARLLMKKRGRLASRVLEGARSLSISRRTTPSRWQSW